MRVVKALALCAMVLMFSLPFVFAQEKGKDVIEEGEQKVVKIGEFEYNVLINKVRKLWKTSIENATSTSSVVVAPVEEGYYIVTHPVFNSKRKLLRALKDASKKIPQAEEGDEYVQVYLQLYGERGYDFSDSYKIWLNEYEFDINRGTIGAFAIINETKVAKTIETALNQQLRMATNKDFLLEFKDKMFIIRYKEYSYGVSLIYELERIVFTGIDIEIGAKKAAANAWQVLDGYDRFCKQVKQLFEGCAFEFLEKSNRLKITNTKNDTSVIINYGELAETIGHSGIDYDENMLALAKKLDWKIPLKAETAKGSDGGQTAKASPESDDDDDDDSGEPARMVFDSRILTKKIKSKKWLEHMLSIKNDAGEPQFADLVKTTILDRVEVYAWEDSKRTVWVKESDLKKEGITSSTKLEKRFLDSLDRNLFWADYFIVYNADGTPRAVVAIGQNVASILVHRRLVAGLLSAAKVLDSFNQAEVYAPEDIIVIIHLPDEDEKFVKKLAGEAKQIVKKMNINFSDKLELTDSFDFKESPVKPVGQFELNKIETPKDFDLKGEDDAEEK